MNVELPSLEALAQHLEITSQTARMGHGWTYDKEVLMLRAAGEELKQLRQITTELADGTRVILPKTKEHAEAMVRIAFSVLDDLQKADQFNQPT